MPKINIHKFKDIKIPSSKLGIHVENIFIPTGINQRAFRIDYYSIILIKNGLIELQSGSDKNTIGKNIILITNPSCINEFEVKEKLVAYKVHFTSNFIQQLGIKQHKADFINFFSGNNVRTIKVTKSDLSHLKKIIEQLLNKINSINDNYFAEEVLQSLFKILVFEIGSIIKRDKLTYSNPSIRQRDLALKFINYLSFHSKKQHNVEFYARELNISSKYLNRIVHFVFGKSPKELIDEKLVNELKTNLLSSDLSISQIASEFNFSDQSVMGKFFKRHVGISPASFRNSN